LRIPWQIWTTRQETGLPTALPFALVLLVVALPLPWPPTSGARVLEADADVLDPPRFGPDGIRASLEEVLT
jgi:hypothetical protein